jgi:hypothetical protein
MLNLKNLFTRALLALMLLTGAGAALAGPTYHVTIDTAAYTGTGALDLYLSSYGASSDKAYLGNFTGDFFGTHDLEGDVSGDIGSGVVLTTRDGFAWFGQTLKLGGRFGFDLRFDLASGVDPVGFSVGLFVDDLGRYLGVNESVVAIELIPGQPDLVFVDGTLAAVGEVPEPATLVSLMLGLTLMGSTLRARRRK